MGKWGNYPGGQERKKPFTWKQPDNSKWEDFFYFLFLDGGFLMNWANNCQGFIFSVCPSAELPIRQVQKAQVGAGVCLPVMNRMEPTSPEELNQGQIGKPEKNWVHVNPGALRNIRWDRCLVDAPYAAVSTGFQKAGAGRWEDIIPGAKAAAPIHIYCLYLCEQALAGCSVMTCSISLTVGLRESLIRVRKTCKWMPWCREISPKVYSD